MKVGTKFYSVISGFRRGVNEVCALMEYYAAWMVAIYRRFGTSYWSHHLFGLLSAAV
jgi:hypothetical protein